MMELKDKAAVDKMFEALDKTYEAMGSEKFKSIANEVFSIDFGGPKMDEYFNEFEANYDISDLKIANEFASFTQQVYQKVIRKPDVSFANGWIASQLIEVMPWSSVHNLLHDYGVKYVFPDYVKNGFGSNVYSAYNPPGLVECSIRNEISYHQPSADGFLF